jgi:serine kinase of HPr protein (carbohydrate metabolism regulator)
MKDIFEVINGEIKFFDDFNSPLSDEIIQSIIRTNCDKLIFGKNFNQDTFLMKYLEKYNIFNIWNMF